MSNWIKTIVPHYLTDHLDLQVNPADIPDGYAIVWDATNSKFILKEVVNDSSQIIDDTQLSTDKTFSSAKLYELDLNTYHHLMYAYIQYFGQNNNLTNYYILDQSDINSTSYNTEQDLLLLNSGDSITYNSITLDSTVDKIAISVLPYHSDVSIQVNGNDYTFETVITPPDTSITISLTNNSTENKHYVYRTILFTNG